MMKFDLHIHSRRSYDSFSSVENIIKYAKKRNLNGVAITDHEHFLSNNDFNCSLDQDIWVIKGAEMWTEMGDIIGLFLSSPLKCNKPMDLINEIHDQNGIAILAHPFKRRKYSYPEEILRLFDAIEVANGRWKDLRLFSQNQEVNHLLSVVEGRSAGSDSHFAFEVGRTYLTTPYVATQEELKKKICSGEGQAIYSGNSEWLDGFSQGVKFLKNPSIKQFLRTIYWSSQYMFFQNRRKL